MLGLEESDVDFHEGVEFDFGEDFCLLWSGFEVFDEFHESIVLFFTLKLNFPLPLFHIINIYFLNLIMLILYNPYSHLI